MLRTKSILIFGIKSLTFYILIIAAGYYLNFGEYYSNNLRTFGNLTLKKVGSPKKVSFNKYRGENLPKKIDLDIKLINTKIMKTHGFKVSSWYLGYLPTALLISLILAYRFSSIKRKLIALLSGVFLINVYLFCYFNIKIMHLFNECDKVVAGFQNSLSVDVIAFLYSIITGNGGLIIATLIPVIIWMLVSIRISDYNKFNANILDVNAAPVEKLLNN